MKLLIYGDIGDYGWLGDYSDTGSLDIVAALDDFEMGDNYLDLRINSMGGQVNHGVTILNYVRQFANKQRAMNSEFKVRTIVDGFAYSAASIVALAADPGEIIMNPGSMMMIHRAWFNTAGNALELRQAADYLEKTDGELAKLYATRTGKTPDEMEAMMDAETFFSADEAIALGLADKSDEVEDSDITTALARFPDAPRKKSDSPKGSFANYLMARHTKKESSNSDNSGCAPDTNWLNFAELDRQIDALSAV
jgi:ATP-dependent protease ClpP protease subunit